MKNIIDKKLEVFIDYTLGSYDFSLDINTSLENDLGITGFEGVEFIKEFSREFNVDISEFKPSDYFYSEPHLFHEESFIKPLTLGDLEKAIKAKKLK